MSSNNPTAALLEAINELNKVIEFRHQRPHQRLHLNSLLSEALFLLPIPERNTIVQVVGT